MQTSAAVLDDALDRVSGLDFEIPNPFVNHAPMACEALVALGFEGSLNDWVQTFEASMGQAVHPVIPKWRSDFEWKDVVGDYRLLPEWMGYFERAIDDDGWRSVVSVWVPRFMPGLVAALFHGVIRTAHAVRALEGVDTPSRRAELSRALANWATWLQIGQPIADIRAGTHHAQRRGVGRGHLCPLLRGNPDRFQSARRHWRHGGGSTGRSPEGS